MDERKKELEQTFLVRTQEYADLLAAIDFGARMVFEIGVGTGVLTGLIAKEVGHDRIIGYEIDPAVVPAELAGKIDLRLEDVTKADLSYLNEQGYALVANAPYGLIRWITKNILERFPAMPAILMFLEGAETPAGFEKRFTLAGSDFEPPTRRGHSVFSRGFTLKRPLRVFELNLRKEQS